MRLLTASSLAIVASMMPLLGCSNDSNEMRASGTSAGGGSAASTTSASTTSVNATSASATSSNSGSGGAEGSTSSTATSSSTAAASTSAGSGGSGGAPSGEIPPGYVKGIIGVGYGGIRILSRDGGMTWGDRTSNAANGGDDQNLLRAVAYGKGRWIATGWKLVTSDDGVHWTDHGLLHNGIFPDEQIIEGLAYKDGYFYAAGDGNPSRMYRSSDGITWSSFGKIGDTVKHTGLAYRGGVFVSFGDSHTSYRSTDGLAWTDMNLDDATYCEGTWKTLADCHDAAWFDAGFYLKAEWGGTIQRSTTGKTFADAYSDDQQNTLYKSCAVAEGYVMPQ